MRTHARTKSAEFLLFTVVFLHPFFSLSLSSFSYLFFFLVPFNLFSYYILWFLHQFLHPRVGQVLRVFFLCSPLPLLEPSTLSCKADCSLFRHHLHINAARELAYILQGRILFQPRKLVCPLWGAKPVRFCSQYRVWKFRVFTSSQRLCLVAILAYTFVPHRQEMHPTHGL